MSNWAQVDLDEDDDEEGEEADAINYAIKYEPREAHLKPGEEQEEEFNGRPLIDADFQRNGTFVPQLYIIRNNPGKLCSGLIHCADETKQEEVEKEIKTQLGMYNIMKAYSSSYFSTPKADCVINLQQFQSETGHKSIIIVASSNAKVKTAFDLLVKYHKKDDHDRSRKINFIVRNRQQMSLVEQEISPVVLNIDDDYNLSMSYEKILAAVSSKKSGLILFTGVPGTGKSYMIRWLMQNTSLKFVYIPVDVAAILADPEFLSFALEELKDSILVIEDAEAVLVDREKHTTSATATLLNVTDGILGEFLKFKVLATVNVVESIDQALLRKGRLLARVEFGKLSAEKSNRILKRIGSDVVTTKEMTLGEIYNTESTGHEGSERKPIGFTK